MKTYSRKLCLILRLIFLLILMPMCSCAVMNARYHKWDRTVTRTPEGLLEFAQPAEYGKGRNAILMVHGFGDSPQVWEKFAPAMAGKGYTVSAVRLPGWGEPLDKKRSVSATDWENTVVRECIRLKQDHDHVVVAAHSMGGCISTVLAQDERLPADALILYAPMLEVSSARSPLLKTRTWYNILSKILPDRMIIESVFPDHARVAEPRPKTRRDPFNPKNIYESLYEEMDTFESQPPAVAIPLRLVLPGEDRVVSSRRSRTWFENLNAPSKQLVIKESAGHVLPLDMDILAESDMLTLWLTEKGITP